MKNPRHFLRLPALILAFGVVVSLGVPQRAHALGQPVFDFLNHLETAATHVLQSSINTKEFSLDPAAWVANNALLQGVANSTLHWALTGANGSPLQITNLAQHLQGVGDAEATQFLNQLHSGNFVKSPFFDQIVNEVGRQYFKGTSGDVSVDNSFSLNQVQGYQSDFGQNFSHGGLNALISQTLNCANNQYCSYLSVKGQTNSQVTSKQAEEGTLINQGNGFLPARTGCTNAILHSAQSGTVSLSSIGNVCLGGTITTLGSTVAAQVNKALGIGVDRGVQADEIGELLGSLVTSQVFGPGGLLGLNQPSSANGGQTPLQTQTTAVNQQAVAASGGASGTFATSVANTRSQLVAFAGNAGKISAAATAAEAALVQCSGSADSFALVNQVLSTYPTNIAATTAAQIATLDQILTQAQNTADASAFLAAQTQYQSILGQVDWNAVATAASDATDSTDPLSLYTQMVQLQSTAQQSCGVGGNNGTL